MKSKESLSKMCSAKSNIHHYKRKRLLPIMYASNEKDENYDKFPLTNRTKISSVSPQRYNEFDFSCDRLSTIKFLKTGKMKFLNTLCTMVRPKFGSSKITHSKFNLKSDISYKMENNIKIGNYKMRKNLSKKELKSITKLKLTGNLASPSHIKNINSKAYKKFS